MTIQFELLKTYYFAFLGLTHRSFELLRQTRKITLEVTLQRLLPMKNYYNTQAKLLGKDDFKLTLDQNICLQPKVLMENLPLIPKSVIESDYTMSSPSKNCQKKYDSSNAHLTESGQQVNRSLPETTFECIDLCSSESEISIEELAETQELMMKTHDNHNRPPS